MDKLNIGGREVDTLTGFSSSADIKLPTLNGYVEKARKEGWLKPALTVGASFMYFVDELEQLQGKYGRKPAAKMVHPDQHDAVVVDNIRLVTENVQLSETVDYLNDRIEMLLEKLKSAEAREAAEREVREAAEAYTESIISGGVEPGVLEYENA